ncbi:cupredoxin domain-containing protein [Lactiplantibacillus herbarum]|uniref:cupredoxin domain-containing protein n=1 Tax=Lactiplantibacillus herbarum TaxID=1670446 RepID=UPI00064F1448|nr:cupredoxin domain-containing protein [Lactiplantibacillus herbarum]
MDKLIVLVVGVAAIGFIVWWFFGHHEASAAEAQVSEQAQSIDIVVNGGYSPEHVVLKKGTPAVLNFTRKDASGCLDHVVFPDFGINQELPRGEKVAVEINTEQAGEFSWACGMDMFHGKIVIQ